MSTYCFGRNVPLAFDDAVARVTEELAKVGFGVLTDIDVRATMKKKLDVDFRNYRILGACNPNLAYQAYTANPDVASLLPCNAVIREIAAGKISVELAAPSALMRMLGDAKLATAMADALPPPGVGSGLARASRNCWTSSRSNPRPARA